MSGIYIHIPFCRRICHYCDFHHSASLEQQGEMLAAISAELERRRGEIEAGSVRTLYFGGGTPSVCTPQQIAALVQQTKALWKVETFEEVTLEANPDDLTPEYLTALRRAGIDRLSIGIQSFHDEHLQRMNRRHTAKGAIQAVRDAQAAGFSNITIDLIYGFPGMTPQQWEQNLDRALGLKVQHISAYHLTIEPHTPFGKQGLQPVDESTSQLHFDRLRHRLTEAGYEHYEVSNFARSGYRARHNSFYWQGEPYLGAGPSAHSYDGGGCRKWNVSNNNLYLQGIPPASELLTGDDLLNEYLMTRLRTAEGISLAEISGRFGQEAAARICRRCEQFEEQGKMCRTQAGFAIPGEHFLISDYLIGELFA